MNTLNNDENLNMSAHENNAMDQLAPLSTADESVGVPVTKVKRTRKTTTKTAAKKTTTKKTAASKSADKKEPAKKTTTKKTTASKSTDKEEVVKTTTKKVAKKATSTTEKKVAKKTTKTKAEAKPTKIASIKVMDKVIDVNLLPSVSKTEPAKKKTTKTTKAKTETAKVEKTVALETKVEDKKVVEPKVQEPKVEETKAEEVKEVEAKVAEQKIEEPKKVIDKEVKEEVAPVLAASIAATATIEASAATTIDSTDTNIKKDKPRFFSVEYLASKNHESLMNKGIWLFILNAVIMGAAFTTCMYLTVNSAAFSFYRLTFYDSTFVLLKTVGMSLLLDALFIASLKVTSMILKIKVNTKHLIAMQGYVSLYQCLGIILGFALLTVNVYAGVAALLLTFIMGALYAVKAYVIEAKASDNQTLIVFGVTYMIVLVAFMSLLPLIGGTFTRLV